MTSPTLISAARRLVQHVQGQRSVNGWCDGMCDPFKALEAALKEAEEEPRVERVLLVMNAKDCRIVEDPQFFNVPVPNGYDIYAERPLPPPKKEPSIEERLESLADDFESTEGSEIPVLREAAATTRELRGKK